MKGKYTRPGNRRHYYVPWFPVEEGKVEPVCGYCDQPREKGNHAPIPKQWHDAIFMLAFHHLSEEHPNFLFRPIEITKLSQAWMHPLVGYTVVRGLRRAELVRRPPPAQVPRPRRTPKRAVRPYSASWWQLTPEGWVWLRQPLGAVSLAARAARVGGSLPS